MKKNFPCFYIFSFIQTEIGAFLDLSLLDYEIM